MFENVLRFVAKVDDKASHWLLEMGTTIDQAEKMALQFVQHLGQVRSQQETMAQIQKEQEEAAKMQADSTVPTAYTIPAVNEEVSKVEPIQE
jgi:hypothetical protein